MYFSYQEGCLSYNRPVEGTDISLLFCWSNSLRLYSSPRVPVAGWNDEFGKQLQVSTVDNVQVDYCPRSCQHCSCTDGNMLLHACLSSILFSAAQRTLISIPSVHMINAFLCCLTHCTAERVCNFKILVDIVQYIQEGGPYHYPHFACTTLCMYRGQQTSLECTNHVLRAVLAISGDDMWHKISCMWSCVTTATYTVSIYFSRPGGRLKLCWLLWPSWVCSRQVCWPLYNTSTNPRFFWTSFGR